MPAAYATGGATLSRNINEFSAFRGEGMVEFEFTPPPPRGAEKLCG